MKYSCPVCGFNGMAKPPADYYICPCCGTEFGYDDIAHSWSELRDRWLKKGGLWFSRHVSSPAGWNPALQLLEAGFVEQRVTAENLEETLPVQEFGPRGPN